MKRKLKSKIPHLYIVLGFLTVVLVGCALLLLPFSTTEGISFINALFISVSAVCITGLSPVVLSTTFTVFGKIVIAILIQLGGLGFVTIAVSVFVMLGINLGISDKFLVGETLGSNRELNYKTFIHRAVIISIVVEFVGFIFTLISLATTYSGWELIGVSAFHSISAFNNAGFDIFGATSLIGMDNPMLKIVTALLCIVGGLGFIVINDVLHNKRWRRFTVHTKIVLIMTGILLTVGTLGFFFFEWGISFLDAFFMSAMTRTCGFSSVNVEEMRGVSLLLMNILMLIGAGPASTGGGVKCTTVFLIVAVLVSFIKGKKTIVFHRYVSTEVIIRSMLLTLFAIASVFVTGLIICTIEPEMSIAGVFTETVSSFANVGLSTGITAEFTDASKIFLCLAMFIGRIGFMTLLMMMRRSWNRKEDSSIRYVEGDFLVG